MILVCSNGCSVNYLDREESNWSHSYYDELVRKPGKLQRNKQRSKDLCWKVHDPAQSFVLCSHTLAELRNRHVSIRVSSSGTNYDLLCLCRIMAKKANKNIEQRILPSFLSQPIFSC